MSGQKIIEGLEEAVEHAKSTQDWESFGRRVINEIWRGHCEIDGADIQEWAERCGQIEPVAYDPARHGDGPMDYDIEPGDTIYQFTKPE
ncbi:MAG: hypothetical protein AAGB05_04415 [Pseudomonadota bacterium]